MLFVEPKSGLHPRMVYRGSGDIGWFDMLGNLKGCMHDDFWVTLNSPPPQPYIGIFSLPRRYRTSGYSKDSFGTFGTYQAIDVISLRLAAFDSIKWQSAATFNLPLGGHTLGPIG